MSKFYENKLNFIFVIDDETFQFIFEPKQYFRIQVYFKFCEKENLYLSEDSYLGTLFLNEKNKEKRYYPLKIDSSKVNKDTTLEYIHFSLTMCNIRNV